MVLGHFCPQNLIRSAIKHLNHSNTEHVRVALYHLLFSFLALAKRRKRQTTKMSHVDTRQEKMSTENVRQIPKVKSRRWRTKQSANLKHRNTQMSVKTSSSTKPQSQDQNLKRRKRVDKVCRSKSTSTKPSLKLQKKKLRKASNSIKIWSTNIYRPF